MDVAQDHGFAELGCRARDRIARVYALVKLD